MNNEYSIYFSYELNIALVGVHALHGMNKNFSTSICKHIFDIISSWSGGDFDVASAPTVSESEAIRVVSPRTLRGRVTEMFLLLLEFHKSLIDVVASRYLIKMNKMKLF